MKSIMITPTCTETPNRAKKSTADETDKFVRVRKSASGPPTEVIPTLTRVTTAR
jgi:hypothetical protein